MGSRDLSNKRITVGLGLVSQVVDPLAVTKTEANSLLRASAAIRWDGLDFGMQASDKIDDRSLDDDASAQLRGFAQYGGGVPVFWPKVIDTGSVLRKMFNLVKVQGTELVYVERVGFKDTSEAFDDYDDINSYVVTTDGFKPDTEGDGGYAYLLTMLAKGLAQPWGMIRPDVATAVSITGTGTVAAGSVRLLRASYGGKDVTLRGDWRSSDEGVATVKKGVLVGVAAGTASIYASFPGATESTAFQVTVA